MNPCSQRLCAGSSFAGPPGRQAALNSFLARSAKRLLVLKSPLSLEGSLELFAVRASQGSVLSGSAAAVGMTKWSGARPVCVVVRVALALLFAR